MPSSIEAVNRFTNTSFIVGHSFCHTIAGMVSGPAPFSGAAENTAVVILSTDIRVIGSWFGYALVVYTGAAG